MGAQQITITGNLTGDPELRYSGGGAAVARLTVAANERYRDKQTNEWVDGDSFFAQASCFGDLAAHVVESLHKGDRVIVTGHLVSRRWDKPDGTVGYGTDLKVDEIAASLRFAEVTIRRMVRTGSGTGSVDTSTGEVTGFQVHDLRTA